jgi:hypothetical protein
VRPQSLPGRTPRDCVGKCLIYLFFNPSNFEFKTKPSLFSKSHPNFQARGECNESEQHVSKALATEQVSLKVLLRRKEELLRLTEEIDRTMEAELHARSTCNRMLSLTAAASAASAEVPSLREVELHPRTVVSDLFFFLECLSFLFNFNYKYFQVQFFF